MFQPETPAVSDQPIATLLTAPTRTEAQWSQEISRFGGFGGLPKPRDAVGKESKSIHFYVRDFAKNMGFMVSFQG